MLATVADLRPLQQAMTGQPGDAVPVSARAAVAVSGADLSLTQIAVAAGKAAATAGSTLNLASPVAIDGDVGGRQCRRRARHGVAVGPAAASAGQRRTVVEPAGRRRRFCRHQRRGDIQRRPCGVHAGADASDLKGVAQFRPSEIALDDLDGIWPAAIVSGTLTFRRNADGVVGHGQLELDRCRCGNISATDKKTIDARLTLKARLRQHRRNARGAGWRAAWRRHGRAQRRASAGLDPAAFPRGDARGGSEQGHRSGKNSAGRECGARHRPSRRAAGRCRDDDHRRQDQRRQCHACPRRTAARWRLPARSTSTPLRSMRASTLSAPTAASCLDPGTRPELAVALKGPLAAPARSLDISALTGWLALRAAELQTRRWNCSRPMAGREVIGRAVRPDFAPYAPRRAGTIVEYGVAGACARHGGCDRCSWICCSRNCRPAPMPALASQARNPHAPPRPRRTSRAPTSGAARSTPAAELNAATVRHHHHSRGGCSASTWPLVRAW